MLLDGSRLYRLHINILGFLFLFRLSVVRAH
jgi:hypothetical protein